MAAISTGVPQDENSLKNKSLCITRLKDLTDRRESEETMPNKVTETVHSTLDRDLLIELRTILTDFKLQTEKQFNRLNLDNADHETRLRKLEDLVIQIDPISRHAFYDEMLKEWDNFKIRWQIYNRQLLWLISLVSGVVSSIMTIYISKWL